MERKDSAAREKRGITPKDLLTVGFLLTLFFFFAANLPGVWRQISGAVAAGETESKVVNIEAFSTDYNNGFLASTASLISMGWRAARCAKGS